MDSGIADCDQMTIGGLAPPAALRRWWGLVGRVSEGTGRLAEGCLTGKRVPLRGLVLYQSEQVRSAFWDLTRVVGWRFEG